MLRTLWVSLRAILVATALRLRGGPTAPSWTWTLEWLVASYRAALVDSMSLSPARVRALAIQPPSRAARRLTIQEVELGGVRARCAHMPGGSAGRSLLYLHGGGFVIGSPLTHLDLTACIALRSEARVWSLDYRLAPERPFPAAPQDVFAAYRALLDQGVDPSQVVVAGDSAGGTLALGLLVQLQQHGLPLPAGGVLISPAPDLSLPGRSWHANAPTDWLTRELASYWIGLYAQGRDPSDPLLSPIRADLSGLPPLLLQVGSGECLRDDVVELAGRCGARPFR